MKKIGLYGGTFNPIHLGHVHVICQLLDLEIVDEVIVIPCALPPIEKSTEVVNADHRINMVRLALKEIPQCLVSDVEILRAGPSYTIDTVKFFSQHSVDQKLFFVLGSDAANSLSTWKDIEELASLVHFIIVRRPGHVLVGCEYEHSVVDIRAENVSSSEIVNALHRVEDVSDCLPAEVIRYIKDHHLYQQDEVNLND